MPFSLWPKPLYQHLYLRYCLPPSPASYILPQPKPPLVLIPVFPHRTNPRQSLSLNTFLLVEGGAYPNLRNFLMYSGQNLSISIHSLEFGVGGGHFYRIAIHDAPVWLKISIIFSSFPRFSSCISLHIGCFFNFSAIPFLSLFSPLNYRW